MVVDLMLLVLLIMRKVLLLCFLGVFRWMWLMRVFYDVRVVSGRDVVLVIDNDGGCFEMICELIRVNCE